MRRLIAFTSAAARDSSASTSGKDDAWPQVEKIATRAGARTSFFDSEQRKLYVAAPATKKVQAAILVFDAK
jgi:hypothetical protein